MKVLKSIFNWLAFLFTGKGDIANEAIDAGVIDYSGQGRDKYGHSARAGSDGHGTRFDDLSGKTFGLWNVLELDHTKQVGSNKSTLTYYKCECKACGRIFVRSRPTLLTAKGVYHRGKCVK